MAIFRSSVLIVLLSFVSLCHAQNLQQIREDAYAKLRAATTQLRDLNRAGCQRGNQLDCDKSQLLDAELILLDLESKYKGVGGPYRTVIDSKSAEKISAFASDIRDRISALGELLK